MFYFAYGSNMNHKHMKDRCPQTVFLAPALLTGFSLAFRYPSTSFPGGGAADIIEEENSQVWGALWQSNEKDFVSLDKFEDVACGGYRRIEIEVFSKDSNLALKAITYEVVDKLSFDMRPVKAYESLVLSGAKESLLPEEYIQDIKAFISAL
jgi:gamma-glutamylcyclotransferase